MLEDRNPSSTQETKEPAPRLNRFSGVWVYISRAGLAENALRIGTHALLLSLILLVAWGLRRFYSTGWVSEKNGEAVSAALLPSATSTNSPPVLPVFELDSSWDWGIFRQVQLHTDLPSQPRWDVSIYTVKAGDTLFGIAEKFGLEPETVLWANQIILGDNPHNLRPGQELTILPVDGTYHRWSAGEGLNGVAKFYGVSPEEIINFPGNNLTLDAVGDWSNPSITPGTMLIVPGGHREFVSWSAPVIPLDDPGVASILGPGACESVTSGAVGNGTFVWPANNHFLSGFDYTPSANHPGIDIDGEEGDPVYATDSGVIVYAGWNSWGYGYMIVINHGNGWQTLYAHLSAVYVNCGQSVVRGGIIGAIGSTGNATGSHLHFEMMYNGVKVNPHDYLR